MQASKMTEEPEPKQTPATARAILLQGLIFIAVIATVAVLYSLRAANPAWNAYAFLALLLIWSLMRFYYAAKAARPVAASRKGAKESALLFAVSLGMFFLPMAYFASPALGFADMALPHWLHIIGLIAGVAGVYLFWCSHADLGENWSATLEIKTKHRLVTTGVYAHMRHPMYTAIFLLTIAQAFLIDNWLAGPAGFFAFLVLYVLRVRSEEAMMAETFPGDWPGYAARTPRLIPRRTSQ